MAAYYPLSGLGQERGCTGTSHSAQQSQVGMAPEGGWVLQLQGCTLVLPWGGEAEEGLSVPKTGLPDFCNL